MRDEHKSKEQLAAEVRELRRQLDEAEARRQDAEKALRESETRFHAFMDHSPAVAFMADEAGRLVYSNRGFREAFRHSAGQPAAPGELPDELKFLIGARDGRAEQAADSVQVLGHPPRHWLMVRFPFQDVAGRRFRGGIGLDVTERDHAEALLDVQRRVLEAVTSEAPLPDVLTVLARTIEGKARGMLCSVLLLDGDRLRTGAGPSLPEGLSRAIDGVTIGPRVGSCGTAAYRNEPVIVEDVATDPLWADYRGLAAEFGLGACWSIPICSRQGRVLGTFAMYYRKPRQPDAFERRLIEVSAGLASVAIERKRFEEALQQRERLFRAVIEAAGAVPYTRNYLTGTIDYVGPGITALTGFAPEEFTPALWDSLVQEVVFPGQHVGVAPDEAARRLRGEASDVHVDVRVRTKDGRERWLFNAHVKVLDEAGAVVGTWGLLQDITDRKRMEHHLAQVRTLEAVGRLAGGVAHAFNNALTVILGFAELTLAELGPDDPLRPGLVAIDDSARLVADLVAQLLACGQKSILAPRPLAPNDLIRELSPAIDQLVRGDVVLVTRLAPDLGAVKADPAQLRQVLLTLVANARGAMPDGGTLILETSNRPGLLAAVPDSPGPWVELAVSDTGQEIPEAVRLRLFEPYVTVEEVGMEAGLGLAMVYGTIKQAGGHVEVESEPDRGTTFRIFLPRLPSPEISPT